MLQGCRTGGQTYPRVFSEGARDTQRGLSEYLKAAPEITPELLEATNVRIATVPICGLPGHCALPTPGVGALLSYQGQQVKAPGPSGVGNREIMSRTHLLVFLSSPDPWLRSSRLETN